MLVLRLDVGPRLTEDIWLDSVDGVLCGDVPAGRYSAVHCLDFRFFSDEWADSWFWYYCDSRIHESTRGLCLNVVMIGISGCHNGGFVSYCQCFLAMH